MKAITVTACLWLLAANAIAQSETEKPSFKAYANYDFVAGDKIIFSDDFSDSQDGEFGIHWKLLGGQAVVNKVEDESAFFVTKYYTVLAPRVKTPTYLPANYTIEFDAWLDAGYDSNPGIGIRFTNGTEPSATISTNNMYTSFDDGTNRLNGDYPAAIASEKYFNTWHHYAIAVKDKQLKIYCDQYRILSIPETNFKAGSIVVFGDASEGKNMIFKNFKLASGGNMNLVGKAFTTGKYVSHNILFDVNKATIKPESMGEINAIAKALKENNTLQFEIGGYTDADGDDASNLKLSQARADAVKNVLVSAGIDAARLTAKGYGETKPVSDNTTPEGKANNRRVEFVKK